MFIDNGKLTLLLVLVLLSASGCTTTNSLCEPYPSLEFKDEGMQCSGMRVTQVPRLLKNSLQMLLLTGTAISSLDNSTFRGLEFPQLTTLYVAQGNLSSVAAHAFCTLPVLTKLYLSSNRLDKLDDLSFTCNKFLKTVNLEDNPSLRHLPRLVSSSVERLYLDNCNLATMDITTVEGMTALKVLSLAGNRDLHCQSIKTQFKQARPELLVICEYSAGDLPSSTLPGEEEWTSEKPCTESYIPAIASTDPHIVVTTPYTWRMECANRPPRLLHVGRGCSTKHAQGARCSEAAHASQPRELDAAALPAA
ncbi:toll-like receptor 8 [Schistocerca piceifrons]|uniref:toll-like receptor 8 n=1 Tax=Schistocerca piceifrons TaxID=274613 RepID=UPI001F5E4C10|nr:toll-like receptor 8 [Schistocerca piceifrons]